MPVAEAVDIARTQTSSLCLLVDCMDISQAIQSHVVLHKAGVREILAWIQVLSLAEFLRRLLPSSETGVFDSQDAVGYEVAGIGLLPELAALDSLVDLPVAN